MTHSLKTFTSMLAVAIVALTLGSFTSNADAGNVMVKLGELGSTRDYGYGARGLYLGDDWDDMSEYHTNWKWEKENVLLTIFDGTGPEAAGDAQITGTMTRYHNNEIWGFTIDLKGLKQANSHDDATFDMNMLQGNNEGYDWAELEMTLSYGGTSIVPRDDWYGLAMPDIGHVNVAEIRTNDEGKIRFDAWYQHVLDTIEIEKKRWVWVGPGRYDYEKEYYTKTIDDENDPDYYGHKHYNVGDTKAEGWLMEPDDTPEIPTPAALPAGLALLGLAAARRRRNRK